VTEGAGSGGPEGGLPLESWKHEPADGNLE
jgi:hypothetical protein